MLSPQPVTMRKKIATFLLISWVWSLFGIPSLQAKDETPPPEPDLSLSPQDTEFGERSDKAEKFTFKELPRDLGGSMKASFWGWGGLAFGLGAGLSGGLVPLDDNIQNSFETNAIFGETANDVMGWVISPYSIGGASILTWIVGHGTHHPKVALTGRALTEALFLSLGIDAVAKLSFNRRGPDNGRFSFPSAHSTAAFTAAGVLTSFYGWKAGVPSYVVASLISVSRVDGDQHWVSDVVMGAVLGSVIGWGTAQFHKKQHPNFFLSPQVSSSHASLGFTYIY